MTNREKALEEALRRFVEPDPKWNDFGILDQARAALSLPATSTETDADWLTETELREDLEEAEAYAKDAAEIRKDGGEAYYHERRAKTIRMALHALQQGGGKEGETELRDAAREVYNVYANGLSTATCKAALARLDAALNAPAPSAWQPMETAPKVNGRSILLANPERWGHAMEGSWDNAYKAWGQIQGNGDFNAFYYQPTAWMPLPKLPEVKL